MRETKEQITEQIKKSSLTANGKYDFSKLQKAGVHFLPMEWEDLEEEVVFRYHAQGLTSLTKIRKEDMVTILNLLIQAAEFEQDIASYEFSIEPTNLYYDTIGRIYIKARDLPKKEKQKQDFLLCYKALIACALTGQYSYRDYVEGGEELLKKNALTAPIFELNKSIAVAQYLEIVKENYLKKQKKEKISVNKTVYTILRTALIILIMITAGLGTYGGIQYFKTIPYLTAVNHAADAYIENDNLALIDALKKIEVKELQKHQKYILAKAYLQSESLTREQKDNILAKLNLNANQKELEYWIYLGRLLITEAQDTAMQLSDDELLLYAYLKDKAQTQSSTTLSGADKEKRLSELQSKIDGLEKKYNLDEQTTNPAVQESEQEQQTEE